MNKLIIYTCSPVNKVYAQKILLDKLSLKYKLEIWSKFHEDHKYYKNSKSYKFNHANYKYIKNNYDLYSKLNKIKKFNPLFLYIDYNASLDFIFLFLLKCYNLYFIVPPRRTPFIYKKNYANRLIKLFNKNFLYLIKILNNLIKFFIFDFFNKLNLLQRPNIIFTCGLLGSKYWSKYLPNRIVITDSIDFDYERKLSKKKDNYAVYIDESKLYSPDLALINKKNYSTVIDQQKFYKNLRLFFNRIENTYFLKIIILCSYKYDYKSRKIFGNRSLHYGKTNELIKGSKFVICHQSSGYWQAIYEKKYIIFLTDNNLKKYNQNLRIKYNANLLGSKTIDTNDDIRFINFQINKKRYDQVLSKYFLSKKKIKYDKVIFDIINKHYQK